MYYTRNIHTLKLKRSKNQWKLHTLFFFNWYNFYSRKANITYFHREKKKDIWGSQRTLQFKMMKCYSLHTKIKNETKLKKWNGYQSNAGQRIKGEGSHIIKKKSKRASASRSLQNKGASVSKTNTFHGITSKLSQFTHSTRQCPPAVLLPPGHAEAWGACCSRPSCGHDHPGYGDPLLLLADFIFFLNLPVDWLLQVFPFPYRCIGLLYKMCFRAQDKNEHSSSAWAAMHKACSPATALTGYLR